MIHLIVGHRGVGKTSFLKRIEHYYTKVGRPVKTLDLDAYIQEKENKSITEIFSSAGEQIFRQLEQKYLIEIIDQQNPGTDTYISLGAGYPGPIPAGTNVLWLTRATDHKGRIFLDRPRLNQTLSPLEEFHERFLTRETLYSSWANEQILIREGVENPQTSEEKIILNLIRNLSGALTILPENLKDDTQWSNFIHHRQNWGFSYFELRDDLLSAQQINQCLSDLPPAQTIYSLRTNKSVQPPNHLLTDWALEIGVPKFNPAIISLHEGKDLSEMISRINAYQHNCLLKLAPTINSFIDLYKGHLWWKEDPQRRVFLPRSSDGRWAWYRLLHKKDMFLNYIREGRGSALDQPTLCEWLDFDHVNFHNQFAAILGDPVAHSRTPLEHQSFFANRGLPIFAIRITSAEWQNGAIDTLTKLGLIAAAVTAPLKQDAFKLCLNQDQDLHNLKAFNTLILNQERKWLGTNTDLIGLDKLLAEIDSKQPTAIWGGGGTLTAIQKILPHSQSYSARSGEPREKQSRPDFNPTALIWACGYMPELKWPPLTWRPKYIYDLNYTDDSPGREYALKVGAKYISGLIMFKAQAQAQRDYWSKHGF